jgi:NADPH:quinone reductase-like Zn-dependent oxidoreductase
VVDHVVGAQRLDPVGGFRAGCGADHGQARHLARQLHLVDERIVGHKPAKLGFAEAAALPLTAITAWELLFDRLAVSRDPAREAGKSLLVTGAAGGVGSILVQLARQMTGLTVIGTASRAETTANRSMRKSGGWDCLRSTISPA